MTNHDSTTPLAGQRAALLGQVFAALCFLTALASTAYLDRLTNVLLLLSTFLFGVVSRYAARYMMGDPGQTRFTVWLSLTGASVFVLVLAQNLLLFSLAWCGMSLCLHQLLQFYRNRPGALLAARKKFLISRLGDAALAGALFLTHRELGTWDFQRIFQAAERLRSAGLEHIPAPINWLCGLLVLAALLKSAQFPFHSWLPDTMETPTPVSALMHAGIINAGGILIIRLSPLISLSDSALGALAVAGGFTAVFASVVMLTQASVKRCLAFSTVAQMGFMMLECGLGAYHLALLHLVAHSLYKAYAFLSSGGAVSAAPARTDGPRPIGAGTTLLYSLSAFGVSLATAFAMGVHPLEQPLLSGVFALALSQMLGRLGSASDQVWRIPLGLAIGTVASVAYFALERVAGLAVPPLERGSSWLAIPILGFFLVLSLAHSQVPRLARTAFGRRVYIHARNGFYFNTLANRVTSAMWPVKVSQEVF